MLQSTIAFTRLCEQVQPLRRPRPTCLRDLRYPPFPWSSFETCEPAPFAKPSINKPLGLQKKSCVISHFGDLPFVPIHFWGYLYTYRGKIIRFHRSNVFSHSPSRLRNVPPHCRSTSTCHSPLSLAHKSMSCLGLEGQLSPWPSGSTWFL